MYHRPLEGSILKSRTQKSTSRRRRTNTTFAILAVILFCLVWYDHRVSAIVRSCKLPRLNKKAMAFSVGKCNNIPKNIWQIFLPKDIDSAARIDPESLADTASWLALNPEYQYTLVGQKRAENFITTRFANEPRILRTYHSLTNVGQKSDFLRYLLLYVEGGVYTDTDTWALKPIDDWVPVHLRGQVRLVVGIEFDRRDEGDWPDISHWVQFCQWTIAAAPRHPVFERIVDRTLNYVEAMAQEQRIVLSDGESHPTISEVMESTGPAAWTDAVFEELRGFEPSLNSTKDLSFLTQPRLYGDVLVLTIDGFGMGQPHSHSTRDGSTPEAALIKHNFRGSWKENWP